MGDFERVSQQFISWFTNRGAQLSAGIALEDLRCRHAGRGVVATKDIEENQILFRVPRSVVLSVENSILSNEIPQGTFEHLGPWLSLILVMLYEFGIKEVSNWRDYLSILPTEFDTLMFWEQDELEELQASAVRRKVGKESADERFKKELVPVIQEFAELFFSGDEHAKERAEKMGEPENLHLMHIMGTLIMAYAFDIEPVNSTKEVDEEGYASEEEDEALPKGMVPMADMLNADADKTNARLFYEEDDLVMRSIVPIKTGEEILNDYGPLPRSDLLRRYGYITGNYAQYDVAEIPFELIILHANKAPPPAFHAKIEYLEEQGLIEEGYDIVASDPFDLQESLSPELIIVIKTLLCNDAELDRLRGKSKLPSLGKISSVEAQVLCSIVKARLAQYSTTLEEDTESGQATNPIGGTPTKHRRYAMAKHVRVGEKKILRATEQDLSRLVARTVDADGLATRPVKKQRVA